MPPTNGQESRRPESHRSALLAPEMAVRLPKVFGGGAESWSVQQAQYNLAHVRGDRIKLKRLEFA